MGIEITHDRSGLAKAVLPGVAAVVRAELDDIVKEAMTYVENEIETRLKSNVELNLTKIMPLHDLDTLGVVVKIDLRGDKD